METKKLTFYDIFYTFIFGCVFGWIVEGIWTYIKKGLLINHSALVLGPFNLIYGLGAAALTLFLLKLRKSNVIKIFIVSFLTGTILEYVVSFLMEKTLGFVAWNYSTKFMNINGRVCLMYSIFWGILGIIWIKLIYPYLEKLIKKIPHKWGEIIKKVLIGFLIFDSILTLVAINRAKEQIHGIPASNIVEKTLDKLFGYDYLNNMYNYKWKLK